MGDSAGFIFLHLLSYFTVKQWQNRVSLLEPLDRIELAFNDKKVGRWMLDNWHCSIYFSLVYLLAIFLLTRYMSDRRAFHLRRPLFLWSLSLCLFSLMACARISDYILEQPIKAGWTSALCDITYLRGVRGKRLYAFLFPLSKLPELIDTFFIVFRKAPLSFLHWYHHITVFVYCWFSYAYPVSGGLWFGFMNYVVHSIMYAYYAIRANGHIPIPKFVNKCVTIIQLSQMVLGVAINCVTTLAFMRGTTCGTDALQIQISVAIYVSYGVLFANFFYQRYIKPKGRPGPGPEPELEVKNGALVK